ncbi:hypothetical protein B5M09_008054 [Aphanomyces astaci]|uniref:Uncharacterized protein n=1 Tax=Aphanomyces astaci TaxID=112090 RepID=A0A425DBL1_APHAT|nr:hypothetical protein B5M09_008054 [Aphanomyces astaci]
MIKRMTSHTTATTAGLPAEEVYAVDFRVQITHTLRRDTKFVPPALWTWMQVTVSSGSVQLTPTIDAQVVATIPVAKCSLTSLDNHFYILCRKGLYTIHVYCPSKTVWTKFVDVLTLASSSVKWSVPSSNKWADLVQVAASIVETADANHHLPPFPMVHTSSVTVADVQSHLAAMKAMYELKCTLSAQDLYETLVDLEYAYVELGVDYNFAHMVHQLHPKAYMAQKGGDLYRQQASSLQPSLKTILHICPHDNCDMVLTSSQRLRVHMHHGTVSCTRCFGRVSMDTFKLAKFVQSYTSCEVEAPMALNDKVTIVMPRLPIDGSIPTYLQELKTLMVRSKVSYSAMKAIQTAVDTYLKPDQPPMGWMALDLVHAMARQLQFVEKVCTNYTYWNQPVVVAASVVRYHQFMHIMAAKPSNVTCLVPTVDIDLVWHAHQCNPVAYRTFCNRVAGKLIDHDDTIPATALARGYADTFSLWSKTFHGEKYSSFPPQVPTTRAASAVPSSTWKKSKMKDKRYVLKVSTPTLLMWWALPPPLPPTSEGHTPHDYRVPSFHSRFVGVDEFVADLLLYNTTTSASLVQVGEQDTITQMTFQVESRG